MDDILRYSTDNVLRQITSAPQTLGFYALRFYSDGTRPSRNVTGLVETFYYYPSGGTLRDARMNIIFYEPKLDQYRAFGAAVRDRKSTDPASGDPSDETPD
jgi:hypothetical protein